MSIHESIYLEVGGIKQYMLIRGEKLSNPLMLILHGGPGAATSAIHHVFDKKYEENFLVVHYDQRGAGKSYHKDIPVETMKLEQFISDVIEVSEFLLKKYQKTKLFVMGLSFGTMPGIIAAHRRPDLYYAYIGSGQLIDVASGEKASYKYVLKLAKKTKNKEAQKALKEIGFPYKDFIQGTSQKNQWVRKFNLGERATSGFFMKFSEEELMPFIAGIQFSEHVIHDVTTFNVNYIHEFEIPVYFLQGIDDYQTPLVTVKKFYKKVKAPIKDLIVFEKSAHDPIFSENEKFVSRIVDIKKQTLGL